MKLLMKNPAVILNIKLDTFIIMPIELIYTELNQKGVSKKEIMFKNIRQFPQHTLKAININT